MVGAAIGAVLALKIKMTAMPQLVGLYNGFGGAASLLVAGAVLIETILITKNHDRHRRIGFDRSCDILGQPDSLWETSGSGN